MHKFTHHIVAPAVNEINSKGLRSVSVQVVFDANYTINKTIDLENILCLNESSHDAQILSKSALAALFVQNDDPLWGHPLGDCGSPLTHISSLTHVRKENKMSIITGRYGLC